MCRIVGIVNKASIKLENEIIAMRDAMTHGGPDSEGAFIDYERGLALGHRRLSIVDPSEGGHQPMQNEEGTTVVVFNGELYNFKELRSELRDAGHTFRSTSDTEVLLCAYEQWGSACFARFKGMFAVAIYDKLKNQIILARDHAGIKPLYYYADNNRLYFASEVRSFLQVDNCWKEDPLWKVSFLTYGFLPAGRTTLSGVKMLPKGSFLTISLDSLKCISQQFFVDTFCEQITDAENARSLTRGALENAVERHLIADAPLGVFLSGGIDSSLITILAKKYKPELRTLSIIFEEEKYSEKKYQELIAHKCQTQHEWMVLDKRHFQESLPDIFQAMDQPTTDGINSYFVTRFARQRGLKAVLSGLGADELFGGYPSFRRTGLVKKLTWLPGFVLGKAQLLGDDRYRKIAFLEVNHHVGEYLFNRGYFIPADTARILDMDVSEVKKIIGDVEWAIDLDHVSDGNRVSFQESSIYMECQLLKDTDAMGMWHGVEVRVPFLDIDLVRAVQSIASPLKYGNAQDKFLLIDSFKSELPREIWDRPKKGFQLPFKEWMRDSMDRLVNNAMDYKMQKEFNVGRLSWSRYWAYLLTQQFSNFSAASNLVDAY